MRQNFIMKQHFRIIGDVHGYKEKYKKLCNKAEYTIQLGDNDFDYIHMDRLDPQKHKFFGGNHDNYDKINDQPHCLGDFGVHIIPNFGNIFFVRGGFSRDQWSRTENVSWWRDEELSFEQCREAISLYEHVKPSFMITHECPYDIVSHMIYPQSVIKTRTNQLLNVMLAAHQPKMWVFGHYHVSWRKRIDNTDFVCLNELECLNLGTK